MFRPYSWQEEKGKKTKTLIPAPQYIDYVMTYVEKHVQDNTVFPSKFGEYKINSMKNGNF